MAQNAKNKLYIHDESKTAGTLYSVPEYLANSERLAGYQPQTTISSKNINTAVLQSSLVVTSLVDALLSSYSSYSGDVSIDLTVAQMTTFFTSAFRTLAVSNADNATYWSSANENDGNVNKPVYVENGEPAECNLYAGGTSVTLNGTDKSSSVASFYAPTSVGTSGQILASTGTGLAWSDIKSTSASVYSINSDDSLAISIDPNFYYYETTFTLIAGRHVTSCGFVKIPSPIVTTAPFTNGVSLGSAHGNFACLEADVHGSGWRYQLSATADAVACSYASTQLWAVSLNLG